MNENIHTSETNKSNSLAESVLTGSRVTFFYWYLSTYQYVLAEIFVHWKNNYSVRKV